MVSRGSILAGFRLLAWLIPAAPLENVTDASLDELKRQYKSRDRLGDGLGFLVFIVLAFVLFFVLDWAAAWHYRPLSDAPYFIRPTRIVLGAMAGVLSLFFTGVASVWMFRVRLDATEYKRYMTYVSHKTNPTAPFDVVKLSHFLLWVILIPLLCATILLIDSYTAFTRADIVDNPFWTLGLELKHRYSEVSGVYEVESIHAPFTDRVSPHQVITFSDGTRWVSERGKGGQIIEYQREAVGFVAAKSSREIQYVAFPEVIDQ